MDEGTASTANNPVVGLSKAVQEVQSGIKLGVAAAKYNIPVSILYNRVLDIRQLKKKKLHQEMQSAATASNQVPDKFGLIINQKFFRCKRLANPKGVYVDQRYYDALHFILNGGAIDEAVLNFNIDKLIIEKKMSEIEIFKRRQSTMDDDVIVMEQDFISVVEKAFPKLSKFYTIFSVIKSLTEVNSLVFPEEFLIAVSEIEKGVHYKEVIEKFAFNIKPFVRVIRMLRFLRARSQFHIKRKADYIRNLIPNIHSSFANLSLTKSESLALIQKFYKKRKPRAVAGITTTWNHEDLENALLAIKNGMTVGDASSRYRIPNTTLRDHARKRNLPLPRRKRRRGVDHTKGDNSQPSAMLSKDEVQVVIATAENSSLKSKVKKPQLLCLFCHQPGNREEELGKLHVINKVVVHYYCLLFSCALEQNGKDEEGILGFLPKDIMKEINRGSKLKCMYCGLKGATVGCNNKYCKRTYHFPCGLDNCAQYIFTDNFSSMCLKHRKFQNGQGIGQNMECPICMEVMVADPKYSVWAPCCKKSSWFHRKCIQKLALSAGYFFKCPLCNDKVTFTSEMLHQGVFVPDQDASWELEPNAFQELLERPIRCDAPICKCPAGRKSDEEGTRWEVLLCYLCGSTGIHIACGKLKPSTTEWHCPTCIEMLKESALRTKEENLRREYHVRKNKRKSYADDEDIDNYIEEIDVEAINSDSSPTKRRRLFPSVGDFEQPSSSKDITENMDGNNLDSSDDKVVFVPKGIRGDIVIKELLLSGELLSDALNEMRSYAENFPVKLLNAKMEERMFLETLHHCTSGSITSNCYILDESHIRRFVECSYNYDQMRLLRKVFELVFFLHSLKMKINKTNRDKHQNPFSRKKRRYKDLSKVKESLVNLLVKARSANLLDQNNTWSSYGNRKKNAYFRNNTENDALPSTSQEAPGLTDVQEVDQSSNSSARYIRIMEDDKLRETCMWCNMNLVPGTQLTTINVFSGNFEVICTSCLTCNIFINLFPKMPFPRPAEPEQKCIENNTTDKGTSDSVKVLEVNSNIKDTNSEGNKKSQSINSEGYKKPKSSILNYFAPTKEDKNFRSPSSSTTDKDTHHKEKQNVSLSSTNKDTQLKGKQNIPPSSSYTTNKSTTNHKEKRNVPSSSFSATNKDIYHKEKQNVPPYSSTNKDTQLKEKQDVLPSLSYINNKSSNHEEEQNGPPSSSNINKDTQHKEKQHVLSSSSTTDRDTQPKEVSIEKTDLRKLKFDRQLETCSLARRKLLENKTENPPQPKIIKLVQNQPEPKIIKLAEDRPLPRIIKLTEDQPAPKIIKLAEDRPLPRIIKLTEDQPAPKIIKIAEDQSLPRMIKLTDQPLSKLIKLEELKPNVRIDKSSETKSNLKAIKPETLANVSSQPKTPNTPPTHPSMSISFSNKNKICKTCETVEENASLRKPSTIYCPCCSEVPTFCTQKHFDLWHSFTHNWITIPASQGISRPYKKCKVCPKQNFTRYYCPACPWDLGFCSLEHYNKMHPNETISNTDKKSGVPNLSDKVSQKTDPNPTQTNSTSVTSCSQIKSDSLNIKLPQYPIILKPDPSLTRAKESLKSFRIRREPMKHENNDDTESTSDANKGETSASPDVEPLKASSTVQLNSCNSDTNAESKRINSNCNTTTSTHNSTPAGEGLQARLDETQSNSIT